MDSKHGATGTELRLDVCVKDGSERTWSHEQVRQRADGTGLWAAEAGVRYAVGTDLWMGSGGPGVRSCSVTNQLGAYVSPSTSLLLLRFRAAVSTEIIDKNVLSVTERRGGTIL